jgi:hypothetical protein
MSGNIFVENFEKLASYDKTQNIFRSSVCVINLRHVHMVSTGHRILSVASEI